jgi:hypothetical protein
MEVPHYTDPFHAPVWDSNDAGRLRNLLSQRTGKRLILRLRLDRPDWPRGAAANDPNAVALAAKLIEGYEQCLSNIFDYLVTEPPTQEVRHTAYPNLDDDDAWPVELREPARKLTKETTDAA